MRTVSRTIREKHRKGLTDDNNDYLVYCLAGFSAGLAGTALIQWMLGPYALNEWPALALFALIAVPTAVGVAYLGISAILQTVSVISGRCWQFCRNEVRRHWEKSTTPESG
jgi:hypothetical protein